MVSVPFPRAFKTCIRSGISVLLAAGWLLVFPLNLAAQPEPEAVKWIRLAVERICPVQPMAGLSAQNAIPESWLIEESRQPNDMSPNRIRIRLVLPGGNELSLESRLFNGQLRQFRASFHAALPGGLQPELFAITDGGCTIQSGRRIRHEEGGWRFLDQLDGNLNTLRWTETLQAPWPEGSDPGGIRVALVDSGLAYDLPLFRNRLARDQDGTPLGYDFWDLDPWPYDGDTARGPFLPIRHGTAVASILVREAPDVALIPFRYPRPDMNRMADVVARAAEAGARILAMPLGSRQADDWIAFERALKNHDILAIVSAGNDGRNIDQDPVFPAALNLDNLITVTSADGFGRLAPGSNWGEDNVDIMLPAENLEVTDFRGASGVSSGSSYAVPRLAALAARLLAESPDLSAEDLKERILEGATPSPFERNGVVSTGWIPDPLSD